MKLVQLGSFANTVALLNTMLPQFRDDLRDGGSSVFDPDASKAIETPLKLFHQTLLDLGMPICAGVAHELIAHFGAAKNVGGNMQWTNLEFRSVISNLETLNQVLGRELSTKKLYVMNTDEVRYLEFKEDAWGKDFETKFQNLAFDLEQCHRCVAFSQSTAAVFHLMRILEGGLKAISKSLVIPDPTTGSRDWGAILTEVREARDHRTRNINGAKWSVPGDQQFFAESYGLLDAVKIAWRNPTMHLDKKYDADDAERIYGAVKGFMRRLAIRMDGHGLPLA